MIHQQGFETIAEISFCEATMSKGVWNMAQLSVLVLSLKVLSGLGMILVANHFIACFWYGAGRSVATSFLTVAGAQSSCCVGDHPRPGAALFGGG